MIDEFLRAFLSIFVIMDVLGTIPIFWGLTKKQKKDQRKKNADKACAVATVLLLVFLFFGEAVLDFFGITIHSFQIAGGIIILIVGLEMVIGLRFKERHLDKYESAVVPLATPLITGPGVITTVILLVHAVGIWITLFASLLNLLINWIVLRYSGYFYRFFGRQGADVLSRVMGLILCALAVEFVRAGWAALF